MLVLGLGLILALGLMLALVFAAIVPSFPLTGE